VFSLNFSGVSKYQLLDDRGFNRRELMLGSVWRFAVAVAAAFCAALWENRRKILKKYLESTSYQI